MKRANLAVWVVVLAAAGACKPRDGAIRATITVTAQQKATCVSLRIQNVGGFVLHEEKVQREGTEPLVVGIYRGDYPEQIVISAAPLYGAGCSEPVFANGNAVDRTVAFEAGVITEASLTLDAPTAVQDADGDGFVDADDFGPDCDDTNAAAFPGATEVCTGTVDLNCNQQVGCADPVCAQVPCAQPPEQLAFTSAPQTVIADGCAGPLTVEARDAAGAALDVTADTAVTLEGTAGAGVSFFSDAACSAAIVSATIPAGQSTAGFYFQTRVAGAPVVSAVLGALQPAVQTQTVLPGPASKLVFVNPVRTATAGTCASAALTVQVQDAFGNPVPGARSIELSSDAPAGSFALHVADGCGSPGVDSVQVAAGTSDASASFRGTTRGAVAITATASGLSEATQSVTIQPAAATALTIVSEAVPTVAGICSAVVTLQPQDPFGNASPLEAATDAVITHDGGAAFSTFADEGCTVPVTAVPLLAGATTAALHFKSNVSGTYSLTVTAPGLSPDAQTQQVLPAAVIALAVTSAAQTLTVGTCSAPLVVRTRDSFGNNSPVAATTPLQLEANPDGAGGTDFRFFSDSGCTAEVTAANVPAGTSTSLPVYFVGRRAGTVAVRITSGSLVAGTQSQTLTAAAASALRFTGAYGVTADPDVCSAGVTVEAVDPFGNRANHTGTVNLSVSPSGLTLYAAAGCTGAPSSTVAMTSGAAAFYFRGAARGDFAVTASLSPFTAVTQTQTVGRVVQSAICTLAANVLTTTCNFAAPLSDPTRAVLFYQAANDSSASNADSAVLCRLSSATGVTCSRTGGGGQVSAIYYVVEFNNGVTVQRSGELACPDGATSLSWDSGSSPAFVQVDPAESFVLLNSRRGGVANAGSVFSTAYLNPPGKTVTIENVGGCGQGQVYEVQVVSFPGAVVSRGQATLASGALSVSPTGSTVDRSRTFLLHATSPLSATSGVLCERMVRGTMPTDQGMTFSRGDGALASVCGNVDLAIRWERVQLPAGNSVQQILVDANAAQVSTAAIPVPVNPARTAPFTGAQGTSGQAGGESALSTSENINEAWGRMGLGVASPLYLVRGPTAPVATALFTAYVVQFDPSP